MAMTPTEFSGSDWPAYMPPRELWAEPFWLSLSNGQLLLPNCVDCNDFHYPPLDARCPTCGEELVWATTKGLARLWSWATFHREYYPGYPLPPPYTVLMVEVSEGVRMLATLADGEPVKSLRCDMLMKFSPVEISSSVWIPGFRSAQ